MVFSVCWPLSFPGTVSTYDAVGLIGSTACLSTTGQAVAATNPVTKGVELGKCAVGAGVCLACCTPSTLWWCTCMGSVAMSDMAARGNVLHRYNQWEVEVTNRHEVHPVFFLLGGDRQQQRSTTTVVNDNSGQRHYQPPQAMQACRTKPTGAGVATLGLYPGAAHCTGCAVDEAVTRQYSYSNSLA